MPPEQTPRKPGGQGVVGRGQPGYDVLYGASGNDRYNGGLNIDRLYDSSTSSSDTYFGIVGGAKVMHFLKPLSRADDGPLRDGCSRGRPLG